MVAVVAAGVAFATVRQPLPLFAIGGNPVLPKGAARRVAPVAVMMTGEVEVSGQPRLATEQDVVFVLRNNTGHPVYGLQAQAVVVDASGRPLSEEGDLGIAPFAIRVDGLAFGWFRFSG